MYTRIALDNPDTFAASPSACPEKRVASMFCTSWLMERDCSLEISFKLSQKSSSKEMLVRWPEIVMDLFICREDATTRPP